MFGNILLIIMLLGVYIQNTLKIIKYYQNDNYHLRSLKTIFKEDLIKKPYILLLFFFIFVPKNLTIKITLIIILLMIFIQNLKNNRLKLKYTKRLLRLLEMDFLFLCGCLLINPLINGLLVINAFYILVNILVIFVSNCIEKLILLKYYKQAKKRLKTYNPFIIGITGSCGKTSIKNYIYECLKNDKIIYKSPKSYNTLVGDLITINKYLNSYNNTFVLEMGLAYKNDIKKITKLIKPNISIISEILPSHLETMKSIDNIVNEKMQIINNMKENGIIIINDDNEYIKNNIDKYNINNNQIIKVGFNSDNDYYCSSYILKKDGIEFVLCDNINKKEYKMNTMLIGKHNIYNILIVFALLKYLNINNDQIIKNISELKNYENRLEIKKYNELTILNDSYNSNINGFINALDVLSLYDTKKYIITPGIVEAGKETINIINKISEKIINICDYCYLINNKNTKYFIKYFKENNFNNYTIKQTFFEAFEEIKNKEITVLIENDLPDFYLEKIKTKEE